MALLQELSSSGQVLKGCIRQPGRSRAGEYEDGDESYGSRAKADCEPLDVQCEHQPLQSVAAPAEAVPLPETEQHTAQSDTYLLASP